MRNFIRKAEFFQAIDLIKTPVIVFNERRKYSHLNKAFTTLIGFNAEAIQTADDWIKIALPNDAYRDAVKEEWKRRTKLAAFSPYHHVSLRIQIRKFDEAISWYDVHENNYHGFKIITFVNVDVLQPGNEPLKSLFYSQETLFSIILHDVRSPLNALRQIIGNHQQIELTEEERVLLFGHLEVQIEQVFDIINSLLLRTSLGRVEFCKIVEEVNIVNLFKRHESYYEERVAKKGIQFFYKLSGDENVKFDLFILDTVIRNVLDNAVKFSPQNGTLTISFSQDGVFDYIAIVDDGPGMPAEQLERIINNQATFKLNKQITDGFGLGLIMAKEILEQHGGALLISSDGIMGTTCHIRLPKDS